MTASEQERAQERQKGENPGKKDKNVSTLEGQKNK